MNPPAPSFAEIAVAVVYYLSLAIPIGLGMTVAALSIPESRGGVVATRLRSIMLPAAMLVAAGGALIFLNGVAQSAQTDLIGALRPAALEQALAAPPSRGSSLGAGVLAVGQLLGMAVAAIGLAMMRKPRSRWVPAGVLAIATLTAALPTLPMSMEALRSFAYGGITLVHLLAALCWVGGLLVLATAGLLGRRRDAETDTERAAADWTQIWERFSLVALYAVGALIVSGTWLSWVHVGTVGQLFTTAYGQALAVKLVLVLALLAAGAYNVRVLLPRIRAARRGGDTRSALRLAVHHFPMVVSAEAAVAVGVLAVVPFLRGSARAAANWPEARGFDWTTFGTGLILVALTATALWAGNRTPARAAV